MAKCKAEERAKAAEKGTRLVEKSAPKSRTPVSKRRKVDEASSLEPTFENSTSKEHNVDEDASFELISVSQRKKVRLLLRMTIILIRISAVCFRTFEEDKMEKTGMEWYM